MRVLILSAVLVIVDQLTKFLVKGGKIPLLNISHEGMFYGDSIPVFGDFFKITFVENPGMAFGIDVSDTSKLLLSLFSLFASIGILIYLYKVRKENLALKISLAFILGGAVGNLIDRMFYGVFYDYAPLFYGKVVDFFNVDFWDFTILGHTYDRWPIFNVADASVTIGVIILLIFHKSIPSNSKEPVDETSAALPVDNNLESINESTGASTTTEDGKISN